ncbi:MAG: winged helix-turn-helix domain-containing protein [Pseudomonadota bacterium]|nr:winged helix-turn-helix domain-containing protein [Pseudomonadota bacterium]
MANDKRLEILVLLRDPKAHFTTDQYDETEGVCGLYIAEKIGIAPATASTHLKVLLQAGFVTSVRLGKYTYFKRKLGAFDAMADLIRTL